MWFPCKYCKTCFAYFLKQMFAALVHLDKPVRHVIHATFCGFHATVEKTCLVLILRLERALVASTSRMQTSLLLIPKFERACVASMPRTHTSLQLILRFERALVASIAGMHTRLRYKQYIELLSPL